MIVHWLSLLITPPVSIIALLLFSYWQLGHSPKQGRRFILYTSILLYMASTPIVFIHTLAHVEPTDVLTRFNHSADAIVVLGGGAFHSPEYAPNDIQPPPHSLARVRYAAFLHKKTGLPIIASGGAAKDPQHLESHIFARILKEDYGITDVLEENQSINTNENGLFTKQIADGRGDIKTIYLVTNGFHMKRAQHIFEYYGFKVIPAPTVMHSMQLPKQRGQMFIPNSQTLQHTQVLLLEWMGRQAYRAIGHPF